MKDKYGNGYGSQKDRENVIKAVLGAIIVFGLKEGIELVKEGLGSIELTKALIVIEEVNSKPRWKRTAEDKRRKKEAEKFVREYNEKNVKN